MLSQDDLTGALVDGVKGGERCTRYCTYGASVEDGRYTIFHNGTGGRDTDVQTVHATHALALGRQPFAEKVKAWVTGLHRGERLDLNAAMSTGGFIAETVVLVGERGPEVIIPSGMGMTVPNVFLGRVRDA